MRPLPNVPPTKQFIFELNNFSGGLNNRNTSTEVADYESPDLLNVCFSETGAVSKRSGSRLVADVVSENKVRGLHAVYYGDGLAHQLMATRVGSTNVHLFYRAASGASWAREAGNVNLADADVEFENFADGTNQLTYCTDGTTYRKYTASTNTLAAASDSPASAPKILRVYKNRMYATGNGTLGERVYFSAIGNGESWNDATDYFDVPSVSTATKGTTGDPITALANYQDNLIIFKNREIYRYNGTSLVKISDKHGCVGKRAFAASDNYLYFADNDGVYRLNGDFVEKMSKKIQATWDDIPAARFPDIAMAYFGGKLYVATTGLSGTTNNLVLVSYLQLPPDNEGQHPWTVWNNQTTDSAGTVITPLAVSVFSVYEANTTTLPILTAGSAHARGNIVQIETGDADSQVPSALTSAADAAAGNPNGAYKYKVTFVVDGTETVGGAPSISLTVASKKINLSAIPLGNSKTTSRKIYRTVASGSTYKLLTTISDNTTTTYQDDIADGSLGAEIGTTITQDLEYDSYFVTKDFNIPALHRWQFLTYKSASTNSLLNCTTTIDFGTTSKTNGYEMNIAGGGTYYNTSGTGGTATYGTTNYGATNILVQKKNNSVRGKYFHFRFYNSSAAQPWTLYKLQEIMKRLPLR